MHVSQSRGGLFQGVRVHWRRGSTEARIASRLMRTILLIICWNVPRWRAVHSSTADAVSSFGIHWLRSFPVSSYFHVWERGWGGVYAARQGENQNTPLAVVPTKLIDVASECSQRSTINKGTSVRGSEKQYGRLRILDHWPYSVVQSERETTHAALLPRDLRW